MSVLTYGEGANALAFGSEGWLSLGWDQGEWMDPTRTDAMGVHFMIAGQCIFNGLIPPLAKNGGVNPIFPADDAYGAIERFNATKGEYIQPASAAATIRNLGYFMQPRQTLRFTVNGVNMLPQTSRADANNGPKPLRCNFKQINESSFLVDLAIEAWFCETKPNQAGGKILSHRWTETASYDRHFYTSKTRRGKLIISSETDPSQLAIGGIDGLRESLITTSIDASFIREGGSEYTLGPTGLELDYRCGPDVEQFRMCPDGTTQSDGKMNVKSQRMGSPGRLQNCWVRLRGPKTAASAPRNLIQTATKICYQKLRLNGGFFPTEATFEEDLWHNEVMVSMAGWCKPKNVQDQKWLTLEQSMQGFGQTVTGQVGLRPPDPGTRGTANVLLHAAAYHDPRLAQTLNRKDNSVSEDGAPPFGSGFTITIPGG